MPSGDDDDALLARLNALRPTTVSLNKTAKLENSTSPDDHSQSNNLDKAGPEATPHNDEDDKLLDELLNDVASQQDWNFDPRDEANIKKLAADIRTALPGGSKQLHTEGQGNNAHSTDLSDSFKPENDPEPVSEEQEAEEIIAKMLAEVDLDRHKPGTGSATGVDTNEPLPEENSDEDAMSTLVLPSAPSEIPKISNDDTTSAEDALAARFSGLSLPGAPSFSPSKKTSKNVNSNLPKYTDEEIDSWCVICNDDATVRCIGCDGDLYCRSCWNEGHTGPDAGFEEKRHRWTKYESKKTSAGE